MKSRVSIDVDHDNQPIIKIEYQDSPDVRDKLVKKFLETFGNASAWSRTQWLQSSTLDQVATIRPIAPDDLGKEASEMQNLFTEYQKILKE